MIKYIKNNLIYNNRGGDQEVRTIEKIAGRHTSTAIYTMAVNLESLTQKLVWYLTVKFAR